MSVRALAVSSSRCCCARRRRAAQAPPALTGAVNDFAGVIDAANRDAIARLSERLQQTTGDVLVVATVKTFKPEADIRSYAVKMFRTAAAASASRARTTACSCCWPWTTGRCGSKSATASSRTSPTASAARRAARRWCRISSRGTTAAACWPAASGWLSASPRGKARRSATTSRPGRPGSASATRASPSPGRSSSSCLFIIVSRMLRGSAAAPHVGQQLERLVERRGAVWRRVRRRLWRRVVGRIRRRVWRIRRRPQRRRRRRRVVVIRVGAPRRAPRTGQPDVGG